MEELENMNLNNGETREPAMEEVCMEAELQTPPAPQTPAATQPETPNDIQPEEPSADPSAQEIPEQAQHQTGYGWQQPRPAKKESPYANAPYVLNRRPEANPNGYTACQPPVQPQSRPVQQKKKSGFWKKAVSLIAALALVAGSCGITAAVVNSRWEKRTDELENHFTREIGNLQQRINSQPHEVTGNPVASSGSLSAGQVYARNVNSVVLIESTVVSSMYGQTAAGLSTGSGFILSADGYLVTNYHVVQGSVSVDVVLHDGTRHAARVIGYDKTNDVALLKVEATGLDAVTLGSSDALQVGDQVVAIGNPLGELTSTLTVGYVSAKERDVTTDGSVINMLQTDCAINSGNSGGPLFNMQGEVVGITTAKYSGTSSSGASIEGIGFAIPIDDVWEDIGELKEFGYIKAAYLGVTVQNMDAATADVYGLPVGVQIVSVEQGGAAQRAGLQPKDIILAVDGVRTEIRTDLTLALRDYEPGDTAVITVFRSGAEQNISVVLDERPRELDMDQPAGDDDSNMPEGNYYEWYEFFAPFFGG